MHVCYCFHCVKDVFPGKGGYSQYVGSDPAAIFHPQKKKYQEYQAHQKFFLILTTPKNLWVEYRYDPNVNQNSFIKTVIENKSKFLKRYNSSYITRHIIGNYS